MHPDLTYDKAVASREKVLITGKLFKADVFVAGSDGQRIVVKDFGNKGFFERHIVGRTVIAR